MSLFRFNKGQTEEDAPNENSLSGSHLVNFT